MTKRTQRGLTGACFTTAAVRSSAGQFATCPLEAAGEASTAPSPLSVTIRSLDPRKPVQQPGVVLTVASRLDIREAPPRVLRHLPTVKLRVAVGVGEIAAPGMSVGAGETPIIGIAPAVANALHNATQTRIRSLPIRDARFRAYGSVLAG